MKSPITIAKELQKQGMTVSFWFYRSTPNRVEINVHTRPEEEKEGRIESKLFTNLKQKEISEFLSTFLNKE